MNWQYSKCDEVGKNAPEIPPLNCDLLFAQEESSEAVSSERGLLFLPAYHGVSVHMWHERCAAQWVLDRGSTMSVM